MNSDSKNNPLKHESFTSACEYSMCYSWRCFVVSVWSNLIISGVLLHIKWAFSIYASAKGFKPSMSESTQSKMYPSPAGEQKMYLPYYLWHSVITESDSLDHWRCLSCPSSCCNDGLILPVIWHSDVCVCLCVSWYYTEVKREAAPS